MLSVTVTRATPTALAVRTSYDEGIIAVIRSVPGRIWDKARHVWTIPASPENVEQLRTRLPRYAKLSIEDALLAELTAQTAAIARAHDVRAAGDSAIEHVYRTEPYAHQRAGLEFLVHLGSGALLWEMGLGKTKTAIDYAEYLADQMFQTTRPIGTFRVLVICPNTIKRNWAAEIEKHAGHRDYIVTEGTLQQRKAQFGTARYTIVNCEQLSYAVTATALRQFTWDLIIVDESTRFKTPNVNRTKALHKMQAKRRVILTGTPITGKPEDAWSQIEFVAPGTFGSFYGFRDKYLEIGFFKEVKGVRKEAVADLAERIGRRSYRILKADVLDLPEKVYAQRTVELTGEQEQAYRQMRDELRVEIESTPRLSASNILTMLLRLTQITAGLVGDSLQGYRWFEDGAKVAELDNLLRDELRGEQVVIFGQYQRELEELAKRYFEPLARDGVPYAMPIIYGPTPEKVRHQLVEEFQAGKRRLLFCQNRTGGIGINLTAAQTAIYVTRSWSLEEWLQSQDRLHRIGQKGTVSIVSLVAKGTIDEEITKALEDKQNVADTLTGDGARKLAARLLGGK